MYSKAFIRGLLRKCLESAVHPLQPQQALKDGGWASLPIPLAVEAWRHRAAWLRAVEVEAAGSSALPDLSEAALLTRLPEWLGGYLGANQLRDWWRGGAREGVGFVGQAGFVVHQVMCTDVAVATPQPTCRSALPGKTRTEACLFMYMPCLCSGADMPCHPCS